MSDELAVLIGDQHAGMLTCAKGRRLTLTYQEDYRLREDATPLALVARESTDQGATLASHPRAGNDQVKTGLFGTLAHSHINVGVKAQSANASKRPVL
jgi:hypothetical protein